jgi:hypothetical protein
MSRKLVMVVSGTAVWPHTYRTLKFPLERTHSSRLHAIYFHIITSIKFSKTHLKITRQFSAQSSTKHTNFSVHRANFTTMNCISTLTDISLTRNTYLTDKMLEFHLYFQPTQDSYSPPALPCSVSNWNRSAIGIESLEIVSSATVGPICETVY